jgi:flagellar basal body rod protein FlgG
MIQMNVSLYQAAAAMNATARWQEMITENISSSMMPGFKKERGFIFCHSSRINVSKFYGRNSRVGLSASIKNTNKLSAGQTRYTGVKTDFAIDSPGFFEVQIPAVVWLIPAMANFT